MSDLSAGEGNWPLEILKAIVHADGTVEHVLATYTLQLLGPESQPRIRVEHLHRLQRLNHWLRETEENLTDLLPEGYSVRIREWDEEEK